jgi:raffinose/stachyose/melibiose transport system substrate-binding protein
MIFQKLTFATFGLALAATTALADTTVRFLHVEDNPAVVALWNKIGRDFEAQNKGVKIEFQYLENEAFKAKLPTLLQSD